MPHEREHSRNRLFHKASLALHDQDERSQLSSLFIVQEFYSHYNYAKGMFFVD